MYRAGCTKQARGIFMMNKRHPTNKMETSLTILYLDDCGDFRSWPSLCLYT